MGKGASTKGYIQNLSTKKLMKFIYNPEEFEYGFSTEYAVIKAPGSPHPIYQFVGGNERLINTTLLIDGRELGMAKVKEQMTFLGAWHPANQSYKSFNPSPPAMFALGWFVKKVIIKDINFRIILFDKNLNPLRVECDLSMETIM
jgi:hypothetical protein